MATAAHITVDEYLHTSFEPDAEYVDGEIVEWNVGQERFEMSGTPIYLSLNELFQKIDEEERDQPAGCNPDSGCSGLRIE